MWSCEDLTNRSLYNAGELIIIYKKARILLREVQSLKTFSTKEIRSDSKLQLYKMHEEVSIHRSITLFKRFQILKWKIWKKWHLLIKVAETTLKVEISLSLIILLQVSKNLPSFPIKWRVNLIWLGPGHQCKRELNRHS